MNLKIKFREGFRAFAPNMLREHVSEYFELDEDCPYMLLVAPVRERWRIPMTEAQQRLFGIETLNVPRSVIPAVTPWTTRRASRPCTRRPTRCSMRS